MSYINEEKRKAELRKKRKENRDRKKAQRIERIKARNAKRRQERALEREKQKIMDKQYLIASMTNDKKTMEKLEEKGYEKKGRGKSNVRIYHCSNPKPFSGGSFTPK